MNVSPVGKIDTWSFHRLEEWLKCPFRELIRQAKKRAGGPRPDDTPAMKRGREHHEAIQAFIRNEIGEDDLPKDLKKVIDKFDWRGCRERWAADRTKFIIEEDWGLNRDWDPTGWLDPDVWGRLKIDLGEWLDDALTALAVTDFKTGKKFGNEVKHALQMQSYAACIFMRFPTLQQCRVTLEYTDEGKKTERNYSRAQAMIFLRIFEKQAVEMTTVEMHKPKPSKITCAYCPFSPNTQNGGDGSCEYGVEIK